MRTSLRRRVQISAAARRALGFGTLVTLVTLGGALVPGVARADCASPRAELLWTYPDATTPPVPPNAVFADGHR